MAYSKTTWANGDTITAEKLNKMEDGIANAGGKGLINITETTDDNIITYTLSASYNDIVAMLENGIIPYTLGNFDGATGIVMFSTYDSSDGYVVNFDNISYEAETATALLSYTSSGK